MTRGPVGRRGKKRGLEDTRAGGLVGIPFKIVSGGPFVLMRRSQACSTWLPGIGRRTRRSRAPTTPRGQASLRRTSVLIPQARLALSLALSLALERSELSSWRRGRDSNPRYLAVHCISNAARSTTLPPLLCSVRRCIKGRERGGSRVKKVNN